MIAVASLEATLENQHFLGMDLSVRLQGNGAIRPHPPIFLWCHPEAELRNYEALAAYSRGR